MKRTLLAIALLVVCFAFSTLAELEEVLVKGSDDGIKTTQQQDYVEAVANAKLQAIERAGMDVSSITRIENFKLRNQVVEKHAEAVLAPGFKIIDVGYQQDGTYQVVLSGKVQSRKAKPDEPGTSVTVQKVLDRLPDLLADDSFESTRKIRGVLELLPSNFDMASHNLTREARVRALVAESWEVLNAIPRWGGSTPPKQPVRLVIPEEEPFGYRPSRPDGTIPGGINNTHILFSDGSKQYLGERLFPSSPTPTRQNAVASYQLEYEATVTPYNKWAEQQAACFARLESPLRELRLLDPEVKRWRDLFGAVKSTLSRLPPGFSPRPPGFDD